MTSRALPRKPRVRKRRKNSGAKRPLARFWPSARSRRRVGRVLHRAPWLFRLLLLVAMVVVLWFPVNWLYQVVRKPSELFFPVSGTLNKTAPETWRDYGPLFEKYSTALIDAELLAALAQVEGSGNPVAQTYWRWSFRPHPFDVYRPASTAVGMYQITNGTFEEAKRYCIRGHVVLEADGAAGSDVCGRGGWYSRVLPSHAVELTAAYLDRRVAAALAQRRGRTVSRHQIEELAAVIHLCGAGAGEAFARQGMRLAEGQRCGDHAAEDYVARVLAARRTFAGLNRFSESGTSPESRR